MEIPRSKAQGNANAANHQITEEKPSICISAVNLNLGSSIFR